MEADAKQAALSA